MSQKIDVNFEFDLDYYRVINVNEIELCDAFYTIVINIIVLLLHA